MSLQGSLTHCMRVVAGGKDREIKVWNIETGEEICVLLGHKAEVTALHLSEVGRTLISGDSNGTILVSGPLRPIVAASVGCAQLDLASLLVLKMVWSFVGYSSSHFVRCAMQDIVIPVVR